MNESKPKPLFFIVVGLAIAGLFLYAFRAQLFPKEKGANHSGVAVTKPVLSASVNAAEPGADAGTEKKDEIEAPDGSAPTTVKEYTFVAREKLPEVKEKSDFQPLRELLTQGH